MLQKFLLLPTLLCAAVVVGLASAHGAILAEYNFTANSAASTDLDLLSTAGNFQENDLGDDPDNGITNGEARVITDTTSWTNLAGAISNDSYFSFTLDPGGNSTTLTNLTFSHIFRLTNPTISGSVALLTSLTGFTSSDALATYNIGQQTEGGTQTESRNVILDDPAFTNFTVPVEFRFYLWDTSTSGTRSQNLDNIVLNGTVIPEPNAGALAVLGLAGMAACRRRPRRLR